MLLDRTLEAVALVTWIAFLTYVVAVLFRTTRTVGLAAALRQLFSAQRFYAAVVVAVAISAVSRSLVFIEPQQGGVVISLLQADGYRDRPLRSGVHWIAPLFEDVKTYPVSMQTYTMSANPLEGLQVGNDGITARTADGQEVTIDCSVMFQLDIEQLIRLHIDWQDRYITDFIRPAVRGIVRTQISQYTVDEVNSSKRLDIQQDLETETRSWFSDQGIVLDHFVLRNITFSPEYALAIEQKQVALQRVTEREYQATAVLVQAQADAEAIRLRADGEAAALRVLAEALNNNQDLITLRYVDKIAPGVQVMLLPNDAPYILPLPTLRAAAASTVPAAPTPSVAPAAPTVTP